MTAFDRTSYSSAVVMLQSPSDYETFRAAVTTNPALHLDVQREKDAAEQTFKPLNSILSFVSFFIGSIITLGAVSSLYALVDSRQREIATLRAIGFESCAVVLGVLVESILLAVPGALLGSLFIIGEASGNKIT